MENGKREDYGFHNNDLFEKCGAMRQRLSSTGAYCDIITPLFHNEYSMSGSRRAERIRACIHSTCIDSVFSHPGTSFAFLEDGLVKYMTKYKVTCINREEFMGTLPENSNLNVMLPKCIRGRPEKDDGYWSVENANKQLHRDRGCLRRKCISGPGLETSQQVPWCKMRENAMSFNSPYAPFPLSVQLIGLDHYPMFVYGEPPLPGTDEYNSYVSSLNGRIDPNFLQENVVDEFMGFSVPFRYGKCREHGCGCAPNGCIGTVWEQEVDEEHRSQLRNSTGDVKKRKATGKSTTTPKNRANACKKAK